MSDTSQKLHLTNSTSLQQLHAMWLKPDERETERKRKIMLVGRKWTPFRIQACSLTNNAAIPIPVPIHMEVTNRLARDLLASE